MSGGFEIKRFYVAVFYLKLRSEGLVLERIAFPKNDHKTRGDLLDIAKTKSRIFWNKEIFVRVQVNDIFLFLLSSRITREELWRGKEVLNQMECSKLRLA
ncbi:MAG: hypothetical protein ACOCUF_01885 [Patescibacteria group bacterium]